LRFTKSSGAISISHLSTNASDPFRGLTDGKTASDVDRGCEDCYCEGERRHVSRKRKDVDARIEAAPLTSREDLIDAVFGPDQDDEASVPREIVAKTVLRAEEWIDLADAGPYVDETTVPLYTPNGDGPAGAQQTDGGSQRAAEWLTARLSNLDRIGGRKDVPAPGIADTDTE
jgi:hypothetical protein